MSHVLIVGGGFAGINAAKGLGNVPGIEVTLVDRTRRTEREADAVEGDRVVTPHGVERALCRAAAHVVLRVHLEPGDGRTRGGELGHVPGSQPDPDSPGGHAAHPHRIHAVPGPHARGWLLPPTSRSHVPAGT